VWIFISDEHPAIHIRRGAGRVENENGRGSSDGGRE
jgi:hypothetical protein